MPRAAAGLLIIALGCAAQREIPAKATFLKDGVPFGDLEDSIRKGQRQGFAVNPESLTEVQLKLNPIPSDATLQSDGVEVVNLADFLKENGVHPENASVDQHKTRMAVGRAMLSFLEHRFGREIIHLADTSRVSGGAIYGEATVRDTGSEKLRNAHHVFHVDKSWNGVSRLTGEDGTKGGIRATVQAHWPFSEQDFARRGYDIEDYARMVHEQDPGVLNLWVSLTPGELKQHPIGFLLNHAREKNAVSSAADLNEVASTMHVQIKSYNDTITVLREGIAAKETARWGVVPKMTFGQAVLFYTDRTPHSAVWLTEEPDSRRISAEIRVLVTDRPAPGVSVGQACARALFQATTAAFRTRITIECLAVDVALPSVVLTLLGAAALFLVFKFGVDPAPAPYTLALGVWFNFQENLLFTLVLVRSQDLALQLRAGPIASGCLVGAHKMGTAVGMVLVFLFLRARPQAWRNTRPFLGAGALLQILAAATFASCAAIPFYGSQSWVLEVLVLTRFLMGLGGGLQVSMAWNQAARLSCGPTRALQNLRLFVAGCLGLGAGPLISSLATALANILPCDQDGFETMLAFVGLVPWMQVVLAVKEVPSLKDQVDQVEVQAASRQRAGENGGRVAVVCLCLAMLVLRNLSLASLEVGAAQLLETYGFGPLVVGVLCAAIVFAALPVQLLYECLKASGKSQTISLHAMLWASLASGFLLLFKGFAVFYAGTLLFFPMMALSSGLVMAKMQENVTTDGSCLDLNTTTLLGLVMADFLGRGFGPVSARLGIALDGHRGFALMQIAYAAISLVLFLASVAASHPADYQHVASQKESQQKECQVLESAKQGAVS